MPLVDTNLFGLNIDQRISDTTRSLSAQMIRLGQETAVFLGPPGTAVPGVDEVQPAATEAAGDDASSETTIEASGDPEPPRPTFEGSSGLRCYTDEAMSNTYDYAVDATAMVSVRAAVDGWWLSEAPLYLDRRVLTESGPVPIADTDRTEVTFSDAAGNPQAVLWLRAHGDGWLVESDFLVSHRHTRRISVAARRCSAETRGDGQVALFDADDFDSSRRNMWRSWTHSLTPNRRMQVAEVGGRLVGFAHTGDSDDQACVSATDPLDRFGELFGFYVHPDAWGSGAATALMDAALQHLVDLGHRRAVVWTLSDAAGPAASTSKSGWVETGRVDIWARYPAHRVPNSSTPGRCEP